MRAAVVAAMVLVGACSPDSSPVDGGTGGSTGGDAGGSEGGGSDGGGWAGGAAGGGTGGGGASSDAGGVDAGPLDAGEPIAMVMLGADGGVLRSADGKLHLTVPAGAMSASAMISIRVAEVSDDAGVIGVAYDLQPSGLSFASPVQLTFEVPASIDLDTSDDPDAGEPELVLVHREEGGAWRALDTQLVLAEANRVEAATSHFSVYGLRRIPPGCHPCGNFDPGKLQLCRAQQLPYVVSGLVPFYSSVCGGVNGFKAWYCERRGLGCADIGEHNAFIGLYDCIDEEHDAKMFTSDCSACTSECIRSFRLGTWNRLTPGVCVGAVYPGYGGPLSTTYESYWRCHAECLRTGQTTPQGCVRNSRTVHLVLDNRWWDGAASTTVRSSVGVAPAVQQRDATGPTLVTGTWVGDGGVGSIVGVVQGPVPVTPGGGLQWFRTDAPLIDFGRDRAGNGALPIASAATTLSLDLASAGAPFGPDDYGIVIAPRAGAGFYFTAASDRVVSGSGSPNAGVLRVTLAWNERLIDPATEYVVAIYRATSVGAATQWEVDRIFRASGLTMGNGIDTQVSGSFLTVSPAFSSPVEEIDVDAFKANQARLPNTGAVVLYHGHELRPWGVEYPRAGFSGTSVYQPDVTGWQQDVTGGIALVPGPTRQPFPSHWPERLTTSLSFRHDYLLPGTTTAARLWSSVTRTRPASAATARARPSLDLVAAVADGVSFATGGALSSVTPSLSWSAQPAATYVVSVFRLQSVGTATALASSGEIRTLGATVTLPRGLVVAGAKHVFCIEALPEGGRSAPYKRPSGSAADDHGRSTTCSAVFSAPACSASTCAFFGGTVGCCDAEGVCNHGGSLFACGAGGNACTSCSGAQQCSQAQCIACSAPAPTTAVALSVTNQSQLAEVYWVSPSCTEQLVGTLLTGTTQGFSNVFVGTAFRFRSAANRSLIAEYVVQPSDAPTSNYVLSQPGCSSSNCSGCCTSGGACVPVAQQSQTTCGQFGAACATCAGACASGICQ